jgi:hypothetical protein
LPELVWGHEWTDEAVVEVQERVVQVQRAVQVVQGRVEVQQRVVQAWWGVYWTDYSGREGLGSGRRRTA